MNKVTVRQIYKTEGENEKWYLYRRREGMEEESEEKRRKKEGEKENENARKKYQIRERRKLLKDVPILTCFSVSLQRIVECFVCPLTVSPLS